MNQAYWIDAERYLIPTNFQNSPLPQLTYVDKRGVIRSRTHSCAIWKTDVRYPIIDTFFRGHGQPVSCTRADQGTGENGPGVWRTAAGRYSAFDPRVGDRTGHWSSHRATRLRGTGAGGYSDDQ